jgi:hypothetical protein
VKRVVVPPGIEFGDVHLATAPAGRKLTASAGGFTVAGRALETGQDAVFAITIGQLPTDSTELVFKTVETYSDGAGRADRRRRQ